MEQAAPTQPTSWPPRRVALATLTILAVAGAFWVLIQFRLVFFSLFIAIVLSTAIEPLVVRLFRLGIPRAVTIILISLVGLLVIALLVVTVAPLISEQWATITSLITSWYANFHNTLINSSSMMIRRFAQQMPAFLPFSGQITAPAPTTTPQNTPNSLDMVQQAILMGEAILHNLILMISVLLLTGLWVLEGEIATRFLLMAAPSQRRESIRNFLNDMQLKVGAYTRGLALLTLVMGGMAAIAYAIIGLPNVLLLGIIAGLMEIVPLIGPALGAIPALLVAASTDPTKVAWVLIAYIIIQFAENHLVVPRIMDRTVGVNPVASLLAFVAFGSIFGFLGAILAVPLAAVIQLVLNRFIFNTSPIEQDPPVGRNSISTLRYEAQNLVLDVRKQVRDKASELSAREDRVEDMMESIAQDLDSILAKAETEPDTEMARNGKRAG